MGSRDLAYVFASAMILGGCAATQPGTAPGTGSGATYVPMVDMQGVDPDMLAADTGFCRDQAANVRVIRIKGERDDVTDMVMFGVGMVVPFGFMGVALVSGVVASLSDADKPQPADAPLQQKTLVNCMARKGYRNLDPNVTVAYMARPQIQADARPLLGGRDTYMAESYAKANFCQGPARAFLEGKGPGFERYSVVCSNGQRIALRCEFGRCMPESMEVASSE
ncbi:MAG TPA: hypothetical protein VEP93_04185 [Variovorax sp.]|nr:hypothetical protein [Variovorax sp.]